MVSKGSLFIVGAVRATFRLAAARHGQSYPLRQDNVPDRGLARQGRQRRLLAAGAQGRAGADALVPDFEKITLKTTSTFRRAKGGGCDGSRPRLNRPVKITGKTAGNPLP